MTANSIAVYLLSDITVDLSEEVLRKAKITAVELKTTNFERTPGKLN